MPQFVWNHKTNKAEPKGAAKVAPAPEKPVEKPKAEVEKPKPTVEQEVKKETKSKATELCDDDACKDALRAELDSLGVKWHHFANHDTLRKQIEEAKAAV